MQIIEALLATVSSTLSGTILPWLLGTLLLLSSLALIVAAKYWREAKRSPYFFQRRQAEQGLQSYLTAGFVLVVIMMLTAAYGWRPPQETLPRMALLSSSKPERQVATEPVLDAEALAAEVVEVTTQAPLSSDSLAAPVGPVAAGDGVLVESIFGTASRLPEEFNRLDPQAPLNGDTALKSLVFTTDITEQYEPLAPAELFGEGLYTLYATFSYEAMVDGLEWAWVWRHNGEVVDGGNEMWEYGSAGPGYIFYRPAEGFRNGEYKLEVWVNGELMAEAEATMNQAAVAANR